MDSLQSAGLTLVDDMTLPSPQLQPFAGFGSGLGLSLDPGAHLPQVRASDLLYIADSRPQHLAQSSA